MKIVIEKKKRDGVKYPEITVLDSCKIEIKYHRDDNEYFHITDFDERTRKAKSSEHSNSDYPRSYSLPAVYYNIYYNDVLLTKDNYEKVFIYGYDVDKEIKILEAKKEALMSLYSSKSKYRRENDKS